VKNVARDTKEKRPLFMCLGDVLKKCPQKVTKKRPLRQ
jgi:hypothetical protein